MAVPGTGKDFQSLSAAPGKNFKPRGRAGGVRRGLHRINALHDLFFQGRGKGGRQGARYLGHGLLQVARQFPQFGVMGQLRLEILVLLGCESTRRIQAG